MQFPARVVIVDDPDEDVGHLIAVCLQSEDCEIVRVERAVDGVARAVESPGSVVLFLTCLRQFMSVRVPLANVCAVRRFGIVLSTGSPSMSLPSLPGLLLLRKPFTVDALQAAVVNACPRDP